MGRIAVIGFTKGISESWCQVSMKKREIIRSVKMVYDCVILVGRSIELDADIHTQEG